MVNTVQILKQLGVTPQSAKEMQSVQRISQELELPEAVMSAFNDAVESSNANLNKAQQYEVFETLDNTVRSSLKAIVTDTNPSDNLDSKITALFENAEHQLRQVMSKLDEKAFDVLEVALSRMLSIMKFSLVRDLAPVVQKALNSTDTISKHSLLDAQVITQKMASKLSTIPAEIRQERITLRERAAARVAAGYTENQALDVDTTPEQTVPDAGSKSGPTS